jgi:hypothetical protein
LNRLFSRPALRVACHVLVAAPFVVACAVEMAHGWAPQGDDGAIVFRSWAVLTSHSPLVGQLTHVTSSHAVFDPGPMLFWFLTIPVHLDHLQGGLWGATLLCVVAVCLAVEAAWSIMGWPAAVGVVVVVLTLVAEFPALALDPTWNAHIGLVWFVSTAVIAWAVAAGRLRWWPVLVVAASFAAQCHLMFAAGSLACVVIAPIVGWAISRRIGWWLPTGVLAGVACWIVPVVQQFTSNPGNLSLLWHSGQGTGPTTGITFGLQSLAASVGPKPIWWGRGEVPTGDLFTLLGDVHAHPAWFGAVILLGLALCVGLAWLAKRRTLACLALVTLVLALATVWTLASLPTAQLITFPYIGPGSWPVGMAVLLIAAWSVGELAVAIARRWQRDPVERQGRLAHPALRWALVLPVVAVPAVIAATSALVVHASAINNLPTEGWPAMRQVRAATKQIERAVPRGRLTVLPSPGFTAAYTVIAGVDWLLYADGWRPASIPGYPILIGPEVAPTTPPPQVTVTIDYNGGPATIALSGPTTP